MNLLAIDTARGHGSVALLRDGSPGGFAPLGEAPGFGEVLFGAIERLLASGALALRDLDGFAAATGPGSFTGIRVGLVAAKAFAEVHAKPLVGVSSLQALACAAPGSARRVALLDARRGEVFAGLYGARCERLLPETLGAWDGLPARVVPPGALLVANEPQLFEPGGALAGAAGRPLHRGPSTLAREVAAIAARAIAAGRGGRPEEVEANYIRRPSAVPPRWAQAARR